MRKRIKLAVIIMLMGCLGTASTIYAKSTDGISLDECQEVAYTDICEENEAEVQPRMMCLKCASIMQMSQICLPDSRRYSGTREHKYGLLWSNTCTVTSYDAWGGYYCDFCGNFMPFEDEEQSDGLARHHCLEVHSGCGAGDNGYYVVCHLK